MASTHHFSPRPLVIKRQRVPSIMNRFGRSARPLSCGRYDVLLSEIGRERQCFCTISCREHLLSWAAHTFAGEEDLLYVTSHNPMRHLDLVEIKELLGKASRGVALLVVLPPCEYLSSDLQGSENVQNNLGKPWRNVSSLADFSCWLSNLSSD